MVRLLGIISDTLQADTIVTDRIHFTSTIFQFPSAHTDESFPIRSKFRAE